MSQEENQLLTVPEAADYLSVSRHFLDRDRWGSANIPFIKLGYRTVRYRRSDLDSYISQSFRLSTSDPGGQIVERTQIHSR